MKQFCAIVLTLMLSDIASAVQNPRRRTAPRQRITHCFEDASVIHIPDDITGPNGILLHASIDANNFAIQLRGKMFQIPDFNTNGVIDWAPNGHALALTYSDGGAIGGFHTRVFTVQGDSVTDVSKAIEPAIADFKARHFCKIRGNNVRALKWIGDWQHLLLWTEVYPTSDCGSDLGHIEGYVVNVPSGNIEKHLTLAELKRYPGVCLENDTDR
jgi:hypothetical protein